MPAGSSTAACCRAPRCRCSSATSSTRGRRTGLAAATGRDDVCALPYGINTVSLFGHVFLVMLPAKLVAEAAGAADPVRIAWQAGLVACLGSGVIELVCAPFAERIRQATPRAALLSTLAGIALTFIALGFLFRAFARPIVGLTTLAIVLLTYFGHVRFKGGLPGGFVAVAVGAALAWITGIAPVGAAPMGSGWHLPLPTVGDLLTGLAGGHLLPYMSVIVPMGLFNVVGSLQNIESAEAAGDRYPTAPSLAVNGLGSVAAACFGSCFPTTIYIGHPGWKAMGARAGYSVLNGAFATIVCLTGTLAYIAWAVPVDAGMAIVLWIGLGDDRAGLYGDAARARDRPWSSGCFPASPHGARSWRRTASAPPASARPVAHPSPPTSCPRSSRATMDPRRVRPRAGLHLHVDGARGGDRRDHRAALHERRALVWARRGAVGGGAHACLPLDAGRTRRSRSRRHGSGRLATRSWPRSSRWRATSRRKERNTSRTFSCGASASSHAHHRSPRTAVSNAFEATRTWCVQFLDGERLVSGGMHIAPTETESERSHESGSDSSFVAERRAMTPVEQFAWGFLGSMAVEVVALFRLFQKTDGEFVLPARYRSPLYWVVRLFLAAVGGGLAVAYDIENPILAANIGAATPAIVTTLTRDTGANGTSVSPDHWLRHGDERLRA
jgi:hypothetical protein